ncbi:MAG: hypothetical protein MZV65_40495 [Chromatiales bacterium]|nr:hypothetical protein [Chromatiales bacterium]
METFSLGAKADARQRTKQPGEATDQLQPLAEALGFDARQAAITGGGVSQVEPRPYRERGHVRLARRGKQALSASVGQGQSQNFGVVVIQLHGVGLG